MKKFLSLLLIPLVFAACSVTPDNDIDDNDDDDVVVDVEETQEGIAIISPQSGETVSSPLQITGKARGSWYFEATFNVELYDSSEQLLASSRAVALEEWMTEDLVDFEATLNFTTSDSSGTLVFKKDNPSGLPENDLSYSMPVQF